MKQMKKLLILTLLAPSLFAQGANDGAYDCLQVTKKEFTSGNLVAAEKAARKLKRYYGETPFAVEGKYYHGATLYRLGYYHRANQALSEYLEDDTASAHFEDAIKMKYKIAKQLGAGSRFGMLKTDFIVNTIGDFEKAIEIYDEVITTLPRSEEACDALFQKGLLQNKMHDPRAAIETFETLIRRFPKHEYAPESFLEIGKTYIERCMSEFPDPEMLDLARINYQRFERAFPSEPRLRIGKLQLVQMQEALSDELMKIAAFYQKTGKKEAARIYYSSIINRYPDTKNAHVSKQQLKKLGLSILTKGAPRTKSEEIRDSLVAADPS